MANTVLFIGNRGQWMKAFVFSINDIGVGIMKALEFETFIEGNFRRN